MDWNLKDLRRRIKGTYPFGGPVREVVPDDKVEWSIQCPSYHPPYFVTDKVLKNKQWADPEDVKGIRFNDVDGDLNRNSHMGEYRLDEKGYPLNPVGRTGIKGRGNLGKWGPNHAADPVVTRWKECENPSPGQRTLQFISIQRGDTGEWAIPGGMIDPGEKAAEALKREFLEEVFSIDDASDEGKIELQITFKELFCGGSDIYKGYVDDPRNTDNAWIETECKNFHTEDKKILCLPLKAGDDAKNAEWVDINKNLMLYACHKLMIEKVARLHNAAW